MLYIYKISSIALKWLKPFFSPSISLSGISLSISARHFSGMISHDYFLIIYVSVFEWIKNTSLTVSQNVGVPETCLWSCNLLKWLLLFMSPTLLVFYCYHTLLQYFSCWSRYVTKVWLKLFLPVPQPQETSKFFNICRSFGVWNETTFVNLSDVSIVREFPKFA